MNIFLTPNRVWAQGPGSLETTFNTAVGTSFAAVTALATDSSGNIYVGYGTTVKKIASNGSLTWTASPGAEPYSIAIDSLSRVIVGTRIGVRRISSTGTVDSTFNSNSGATNPQVGVGGANAPIYSVAYQTAQDRVLFLSNFFNSARRLGGLTNTGIEDSTFTQNSLTTTSAAMALDSNNNIYVVGPSGMGYLKRFSSSGTTTTAETTFATNVSGKLSAAPTAVATDSSNNIYVVGDFTGKVKKFSSAGVEDTTFNTNAAAAALPNGALTVTVQTDGKVIVGGSFSGNLKRFNTNGTLDSTFVYDNATGGNVNDAIVLSDGFILAGTASTPFVKKVYSVFLAPNTPGTPTAVAGDARATITVTAPTSGVTPDGYTVTAVEETGKTCTVTGASGSCIITGLTNGSSYTFTSVALNGDKTSASPSAASSPVTPIGVPPVLQSAAIDAAGTTLTLTYNEALNSTTASTSQFTVVVGGQPATVTAVTVSGSTVQLTMGAVVIQGQVVTASYAAPASDDSPSNVAIQDALGMDAVSFSATSVTNGSLVDRTAPVYVSVANTTAGTTITLTYNENLSTTTAPASAFTVTNGADTIPVSSVVTTSGTRTVVLTLASPVGQDKTVTVAYAAPSTDATTANSAIQDVAGNDALSFSAITLGTNSSTVDQTGPVYSTGSVASNGLSLTVTFNEKLHTTSLPLASSFTVLSNGSSVPISSVAIGPNNTTGLRSIVLTLGTVIGQGRTVTVAYEAPTSNSATTNTAIQDLIGNDASSLAATTVSNGSTVDQTSPVLSSASLAANGLTLTLNYNETLRDPRAAASTFTVLVNGSPVTVSSVAASGSTSTVVLTLATAVGSGKAVTVAYSAPAVDAGTTNAAIQDTTGNDAASFSATTVTNSSTVDQTGPVISTAVLGTNGTTLTLTYNETIRSTTATTGDFVVTVDGSPVTVSSVSAPGTNATVVLTLASVVANDKVLTVAYTAPTSNSANTNPAVQDTTGNDADSFAARSVTNSSTVDTLRPTISTATVTSSGTEINLLFSEAVRCTTAATSDFGVLVNGVSATISAGFSISCSNNAVFNNTLTLRLTGVTITSNQTVSVSYTAPLDDLSTSNAAMQDMTGNDMLTVSGFAAINNSSVAPDLRAPVFSSATTNTAGTLLTLTYDETLISTTAPASAFTVTIDGVDFQPSAVAISGTTVRLTMGTAIEFGKTVTVSYAAPTVNTSASNSAIQDASGNDSVSLVGAAVSNFSTAGPDVTAPTLSTVSASGTTVTLTFNETLRTTTAGTDKYTVFIGNDAVTVSAASVSGSTVVLTLASAIPSGELVSVSYSAPTSSSSTSNAAVQDYAGNDAASFSGNNRTTSTAWSWLGTPAHNTSCTGGMYAESARQRSLPNGVTYSVAVSGPYVCMWEASESLSDRGGTTSNFSRTGLITDPGVFISSLEPLTTTGDTNCTLYTMGATLSKCLNRGFVTMTFSEPTLNPVISFAGWGGADGGAKSWSELELVTPGVSLTMLSGTNLQVVGGTYVGVVDPSPGTRCVSGIPAGCGSLQVNGTVTEVRFKLNYNANGTGWGNEDQWNMVASVVEDFGQLPAGYDTPAASHVVGSMMLGSAVTADNLNVLYGTTNADAVRAGAAIPATEDGVSSLGALTVSDAGSTYSLPVSMTGVARTAKLCGWIDFNRDGTMSLAERTCAADPAAGATSATLSWTVPSDIVAGLTYARIRLSYDPVPTPSSKVSSGEVEDYSITIASSAVPNAVNDTSTNAQDINQVISPLTNDNFEVGYPADNATLFLCGYGSGPFTCDKTSLTVPGEGTYTVNSNGTVTFDPLPNYVGTATAVQYQISDTQARARTATITPTVTPSPTASADTTSDYVNVTQSKDVLTNDTAGVGILSPSTARLCSAGQSPSSCTATTVSVTGGVYTLNTSTGVITFTPTTDWVGTAPAVTYQVADGSGQVTSSTYTPIVVSRPTATNDAPSDDYDVTQTIRPLLNDSPGGSPLVASTLKLCGIDDPTTTGSDETESPNNCTKTSLTIPGEGTYTVNSDGTVTFNPLPTFYGTASPRTYQISDALGETTSATITPTVGTPPLPAAQANTSSGDYDTNQTLSPIDGDTAGSASFPLQVSSIRLCGLADNTVTPAVAAETPNSCAQTTVTVPGEGTYTLNTTTGVVTFNPLPTFTGQAQTPVTYQVKDSLDRYVNSTLTPTVGPPSVPTATADASTSDYDTNQTYTPTSNDTPGASDFPISATSVKLCGISPAQTPNSCDKTSLTVPGEGTYTVNSDGSVTFDPLPTFTGTVATPVRYQAKDSLDRYINTTITPTVGPPPVPTASPDAITDLYDTNQSYTPLSNDTAGTSDFPLLATSVKLCGISPVQTPNSCDKTSLTVPGEGTYTVNSDGSVTFDPLPTFAGQVQTPVTYQAKDSLDRYINTTITPTVGPPPVPTATADAITDAYDTNQSYTPLSNDTAGTSDFPLLATSVKLCGLADAAATPPVVAETPNTCSKTSLTVPDEGTYTVNPDGSVTFDPLPSFTGTVQTPVRYQANDSLDRYVNTTITPTVNEPPGPLARPNTSSGDYNTNQTIDPLGNDRPSSASFPLDSTSVKLCGLADATATPPVAAEIPDNCTKSSVTVPGEGTYTLNTATGIVTFDPLSTFTGTVATPVRYQAEDTLGRSVDSTITPTVGPPPVPTASPDAISDVYDTNQSYTPLSNDTAGTSDFPLAATSVKLCGISPAQTPNSCDKTSLTVPGEGTYTVNSDGSVTFDPLSTFTGTVATPVTYQAKDSVDRYVNSTITPTVGVPPVPTASPDAIRDAYDTNQTYTPLSNDTPGAASFPLTASSVKLCGISPAQTPNSCDKTSLTVPGEGTYTVNSDGSVTFDPLPSFTGTVATPVTYQAKDSLDRYVNSTITPRVDPPTAPSAAPETKSVLPGSTATFTTVIGSSGLGTGTGLQSGSTNGPCLVDPATTLCGTTVNISGEGTWTIDQTTGVVTFTASSSIPSGTRTPVTYRITDVIGQTTTSTLTPVVPPPPDAKNDTSSGLYDANQVIVILDNDDPGHSSAPLVASSVKLCGLDPLQTPNSCDKTSVTVPGEGTYTVNANGSVTFDPLPTFIGTVTTPVKYQVADTLGQIDNATITPTVIAPAITVVDDTNTGPYDTNQVIAVLTNDTPSAQWVPSSVKLCGISPVETPNSCTQTSVTVPGEGTYTVNANGTVTFDPLPTFTGVAQTPVTYQVTDVLGRTADAEITPTVLPPPPPIATPETRVVVPSGTATFTNVIGASALASGVQLQTGTTNGPCLVDPATSLCGTTVVIAGQGTWTIDRTTGVATFVAEAGILPGTKTSVTYRVTDFAGQTATSTLTPIVPPPPSATDDFSSGPFDTNQSLTPFSNDSFDSLAPVRAASLKLCSSTENPNGCTQSSVVVSNEGTYTVNSDGTVTFDPLPTFFGTAAPMPYQAEDVYGRFVDATLNPTVSAPSAPVALPETKIVLPGGTITFTNVIGTSALASGAQLQSGATNGPCLVDPATSLCGTTVVIAGEGTWTLNQTTGVATFVAEPGITVGTKTPVTYRVTDAVGQTATSTLTPIVPPPPTAVNDAQTGPLDINQTYTPLSNDSFSTLSAASPATLRLCGAGQTPNNCDKTTVVVANEGTYTAYSDGRVIFDPLPTFIGTATPISYQVSDIYGRTVNATITPTILPPPIPAATLDTGKAKEGKTVVLSPWSNDSAGTVTAGQTGKAALVPTSVRLCPLSTVVTSDVLAAGQSDPSCTLLKIKTADGTYTVDPKTGKVTFVHRKGFTGVVTQPVPYQIATDWKVPSGALTARSMLIPTIVSLRTPMVTVGDRVWRDANGDGYQNFTDLGIADVKVSIRTASGEVVVDINGNEVGPQLTDKNGKYKFTDLPAGKYKVTVEYPKGFRPTIANRKGREKNSSTNTAMSRQLALGESDNSLDFGMVGRRKPGLAHTT